MNIKAALRAGRTYLHHIRIMLLSGALLLCTVGLSGCNAAQTNIKDIGMKGKSPYDHMFVVKDQAGNPVPNFRYKIIREDGVEYYGVTNDKGETYRIGTGDASQIITIYSDDRPL